MLQPGQAAPSFSLPDADMQSVSLGAFKGRKNVVLYFYPRDGTPGCTLEAIDFSDRVSSLAISLTVFPSARWRRIDSCIIDSLKSGLDEQGSYFCVFSFSTIRS